MVPSADCDDDSYDRRFNYRWGPMAAAFSELPMRVAQPTISPAATGGRGLCALAIAFIG